MGTSLIWEEGEWERLAAWEGRNWDAGKGSRGCDK